MYHICSYIHRTPQSIRIYSMSVSIIADSLSRPSILANRNVGSKNAHNTRRINQMIFYI